MAGKSLGQEALEDIGSVSFEGPGLFREGWKTRAIDPDDQPIPTHEQALQKPAIHLGEAPDGGLRAWLVIVASVHV